MGDEITDYKKFAMPKPKASDGVAKGIVMRIDAFGKPDYEFSDRGSPGKRAHQW